MEKQIIAEFIYPITKQQYDEIEFLRRRYASEWFEKIHPVARNVYTSRVVFYKYV